MPARIASAFLPVADPARSAQWFAATLGLEVTSVDDHAAVLRDDAARTITLLGPASGISAAPGLPWAPVSFLVPDVESFRDRCLARGLSPSATTGDPAVCRFLTVPDPDGNVLLVVDR